ncbi:MULTISPECIES: DMT family transporter [Corallococcus]|uniref:DMT family transporter n=1 Tax=Corallococcus TaxID=83461 RepID=UPI0011809116|nr:MULTISPECIES: EamA family transporter [Corallococcus]NBD13108.1 EamA family transporter [Corallococcus silvisoli]TSC24639.1 EamA family transporter [Corallococcus sp. Z5C101001]
MSTSSPAVAAPARLLSASDLAMIAVVVIWGTNYTLVKDALDGMPPRAFMALRFALAALAMGGVLWAVEGHKPLPWKVFLRLTALGFVGNTLYQLCFIEGLARTTAANSGMLTAVSPVVTAALGAALGIERLRRPVVIGLSLAVVGTLLVVGARGPDLGAATWTGNALIVGSSLCWSIYTVGTRAVGAEVSPLRITAITMLTGAPGVVLAGASQVIAMDASRVSAAGWLALVYSALVPLVLAYFVWFRSVQQVGTNRTTLYGTGIPVVAALTAWAVRGERPTLLQALGTALILAGVLLSRRKDAAITKA